jgi:hypothetical protein
MAKGDTPKRQREAVLTQHKETFKEQVSNSMPWTIAKGLFTQNIKIWSDDTKLVRRQKMKRFNFCRPSKFVSSSQILYNIRVLITYTLHKLHKELVEHFPECLHLEQDGRHG